jgi:hypothetical protein
MKMIGIGIGIAIGFCRPTTSIAIAIATPIPMPIFSAVHFYFGSRHHFRDKLTRTFFRDPCVPFPEV